MSEEFSGSEIESLRAEIANLKAMISANSGNIQDSGIDFAMMGSDDAEMPNVPIGGGMENFEPTFGADGSITIGEGYVCVGRKHYKLESGSGAGSGTYRLKVTLNVGGTSIKIEKGDGFADPEDEVSYIPLYELSNSGIVKDYRCNFCVPARE